ncbi:MAG: hypothetical protein PVF45_02770 [Anaerolineae bacterium]
MATESTPVQLTANPFQGYEFVRWSGDSTGTISPATITMTRDMSRASKFKPKGLNPWGRCCIAIRYVVQ